MRRSYGVCSTSMAPMEMGHTFNKSFKKRKSLALRKQEVVGIRTKFPNKIPVIVERFGKEQDLPLLDKTKFLVPQELTMSQFVTIIRNRMSLRPTQAFYLMVNRRNLASMSSSMAELYTEHQDEDGFLYVTYASQEMFGSVGRTTK
uniref:Microtubule associated protein 1 light chain 3 gamma n=2 Tax=Eptatretus burgeri TaxID=7764 RepID=A0A8C4Q969_EPTBU